MVGGGSALSTHLPEERSFGRFSRRKKIVPLRFAMDPTAQPDRERWVVALSAPPERIAPATAIRGTLLVSSRAQIRALGLQDRYDEALGGEASMQLDALAASSWVPMALAHPHFAAVDSLDLPEATILEAGAAVAQRLNGAFIATAIKVLR